MPGIRSPSLVNSFIDDDCFLMPLAHGIRPTESSLLIAVGWREYDSRQKIPAMITNGLGFADRAVRNFAHGYPNFLS
jgi:hypothetical protein